MSVCLIIFPLYVCTFQVLYIVCDVCVCSVETGQSTVPTPSVTVCMSVCMCVLVFNYFVTFFVFNLTFYNKTDNANSCFSQPNPTCYIKKATSYHHRKIENTVEKTQKRSVTKDKDSKIVKERKGKDSKQISIEKKSKVSQKENICCKEPHGQPRKW